VRRRAIAVFQRLALFGSIGAVFVAAVTLVLATFFALGVLPPPFSASGAVGFASPPTPTSTPTATPTPLPPPDIAILAGHWSRDDPLGVTTIHDTGALCPDGLREVTLNKSVADKVITTLRNKGYRVDLLEEFDPRLKSVDPDYSPAAFLSIHSDSCVTGPDYPYATGYKIAHAEPSENPAEDDRLVACLRRDYQVAVDPFKLTFNDYTITTDMTAYHAFHEIVPTTPAAIIELGFMGNDRTILTAHQDELARGLGVGLIAFLKGDRCGVPVEGAPSAPTPGSP
jgi:N-acetylmuramoyl-L-alanine amidase-like protein